jgi:flavin-dependent dehydrogenase
MDRFDVVVVGARCAGSPLALMLARMGLRVCVVDRGRFPSETLSTHVIQPCGVAILERLGLLDAIITAGAVALTRFTLVAEDARVDADLDAEVERYGAPGLCVRRVTMDNLLVQGAAAAGAEVRTQTRVTGLLHRNGRMAGVQTEHGPVHADLVVGADGRRSTVAGLLGLRDYHVVPARRLFAWAYFEGVADTEPRLRLGRLGDLAFLSSPTDGGLYMAGVCPSLRAKRGFLAERERSFMTGLQVWPELADLIAGATRLGPIRVMGHWHGFLRQAAGPGWALLGDAGHFKDPTPAQGIADALRHAERLAAVIEAGLAGVLDLDQELHRWWIWRDQDVREMHWFASDLGAAGRSGPLRVQVIRDIARDHDATEKLLRVLNHDLRPSELFTARRIGTAASRVVRNQPRQLPLMLREAALGLRHELRRVRARANSNARAGATRLPSSGAGLTSAGSWARLSY